MFDFNQSMENHYLYFLQYFRLLPDPNFLFIQDLVTNVNENYHHPDCDAEERRRLEIINSKADKKD